MAVRRALGTTLVHPTERRLNTLYGTIISDIIHESRECIEQRNVCIFADAQLDRSPTGTGTSGRLAQLCARQRLSVDSGVLINRSIVDSVMRASVNQSRFVAIESDAQSSRSSSDGTQTTTDHSGSTAVTDAVVPRLQGRAFVTGYARWTLDPRDNLGTGFVIQ